MSLNATIGQPYGTFRSTDYVYDGNGNKVVGADGLYLINDDQVIGNIQADWIAGIYNKFTYKNISVGFLVDIKHGGDVYSLDQAFGQYTGIYNSTAGYNDLGNPVRNSLADGGGIILPGVNENEIQMMFVLTQMELKLHTDLELPQIELLCMMLLI